MSFSVTTVSDGRYQLQGPLDFSTANDALASVSECIAQHSHTVLDLAEVHSANSAGLALLIEWRAIAGRSQKTVAFENIPDALAKIAIVCQVDSLLQ